MSRRFRSDDDYESRLGVAIEKAGKRIKGFKAYWEYPGYVMWSAGPDDMTVAATPWFDNDREISVQVQAPDGDYVDGFDVPFVSSGDLDEDVREYFKAMAKAWPKVDRILKSARTASMPVQELVRVAREVVSIARTLTGFDMPEEEAVFTADIGKAVRKTLKKLGLKSIRQNYKGTGSQKAVRQLYLRFANGAVLDIWVFPGRVEYGGVVGIDPTGARTVPPARAFKITREDAGAVAKQVAEDIEEWFEVSEGRA